MPRLEIELTSERPDGTWTWRAAGAKQPKGVVQSDVVPGGAKVGDVLRAEADIELDGINVTSLAPPKEAARTGPEVLKLVGSQAPVEGVTTSLVGKRGRDRDDRPARGPGDRPRGPRPDGPRGPRPDGERGPRQGPRREGPPRDRAAGGGADTRNRAPRPDSDRPSRPRRPEGEGRSPAGPGQGRPDRERRPRPEGAGRETAKGSGAPASGTERTPARPRPPKFQPGRTHRDAALAALPEEQRPVAEQILKGGVRAVREALAAQKIDPGPLVTLAENLAPGLRAAEWRDRAEEALKDLVAVPLRELRAIVTAASDAARGEGAREIATKLKEALTSRMDAQRTEWAEGVAAALDANRPLRALRQASRPPGPSARLSAELATRLAQAASAAMTPTTPPVRWLDLLEAVVASPVSRTVRPEGIPDGADDELKAKARAAAGSVPALAPLLGMKVPPPPVRRPGAPPAPQSHRRPHQPRPHRPAAVPSDAAPVAPPIDPPRDEPAEPTVLETTAPLNPVVEAEQQPMTEPGSDPEQLDALGVSRDHVDDPVLVQELEQPSDDSQLGDIA